MKIYCTNNPYRIQSGSVVEFIESIPAYNIRVGTVGKVTSTRGSRAWVWIPPEGGYKAKSIPVNTSYLELIPQPDKDPLAPFNGLSGRFIDVQKDVVSKYDIDVDPNSPCWSRMHAHIKERRVCKWHPKNSMVSTFDLLHEVGHIETTKSGMRRCEEEYYATQWALDRAKEYGLPVPQKIIDDYQKYIDNELARGQRRHGAGYNSESLKLKV